MSEPVKQQASIFVSVMVGLALVLMLAALLLLAADFSASQFIYVDF